MAQASDGFVITPQVEELIERASAYLETLARAMVGALGGKVGLAPRLYLKKLVGEILDGGAECEGVLEEEEVADFGEGRRLGADDALQRGEA